MPTITDIGQLSTLLVSLRRARGMSQSAVARRLGVTRQRVSLVELHPERVTAAHLFAYVTAVGGRIAIEPVEPAARMDPPASTTVPW